LFWGHTASSPPSSFLPDPSRTERTGAARRGRCISCGFGVAIVFAWDFSPQKPSRKARVEQKSSRWAQPSPAPEGCGQHPSCHPRRFLQPWAHLGTLGPHLEVEVAPVPRGPGTRAEPRLPGTRRAGPAWRPPPLPTGGPGLGPAPPSGHGDLTGDIGPPSSYPAVSAAVHLPKPGASRGHRGPQVCPQPGR
jgi:hypothetical protein